jgi:NAD(P)-dependent dehydrogenase (short-subunit alcohol dehydrogenase family)
MGTHCLGPVALTTLLQDVMRRTAKLESSKAYSVRIIFVTSLLQLGAPAGGIQFDEQGTPKVLKAFPNYMESKVGSAWLAYEYSNRLGKDGILCLVSSPTHRVYKGFT